MGATKGERNERRKSESLQSPQKYDLFYYKQESARTTKFIDNLRIQFMIQLSVTFSHCPFPILGNQVEYEDVKVK